MGSAVGPAAPERVGKRVGKFGIGVTLGDSSSTSVGTGSVGTGGFVAAGLGSGGGVTVSCGALAVSVAKIFWAIVVSVAAAFVVGAGEFERFVGRETGVAVALHAAIVASKESKTIKRNLIQLLCTARIQTERIIPVVPAYVNLPLHLQYRLVTAVRSFILFPIF